MIADHWIDVLRLMSVIGLSYGAWQGWRNRPPSFLHDGRKYYRLRDGRFCNRWCVIVKDPAKLAALTAASAAL
ncbi:MAG: hypothetical protein EOP62_06000 [Sphingomonadales bacterium]|nr:MAG: hypothetical protein EOP62_06000 [Sphingomonadales bacterium]